MSKGIVGFTSSETFLENDPKAAPSANVEIYGYIEGTYETLRHEDGEVFAYFIDGAWELPDGRRFSDWAMGIG